MYDPINTMKAVLWEEAKGKLRAMVAVDGSRHSEHRHDGEKMRFQVVSEFVEDFISAFENTGLHK